jgi:mannose-6-phosphate isomerase
MTFDAPLRLRPWLRPMPWGGAALYDLLRLPAQNEPVGEAWLVCDHPLHASVVASGPRAGRSLTELVHEDAVALLGTPANRFPLLIKILDARQNLSVQVHPDDARAKTWAPHEGGKTEAWTVLASEPTGAIYLGLKPGIDRDTFHRELLAGNAPLCLTRYSPQAGETYFVPAGTVHALGEQVMVLEVQQTSDATFRLYDWGRVGPDGQPRALHLEAGLACMVERPEGAGVQTPVREPDGRERLVHCPFFRVYRHRSTTTLRGPAIIVAWEGEVQCDGEKASLLRGDTLLIPASLGSVRLEVNGPALFFEIRWD